MLAKEHTLNWKGCCSGEQLDGFIVLSLCDQYPELV